MADESESALAAAAVGWIERTSAAVRAAVILAEGGSTLAVGAEREGLPAAARSLLAAADAAAGEVVAHVHVGTEGGDVFGLRQDGLTLVCAVDRFTLSSLVLSDMRAALRAAAGRRGAATEPAAA